MAEVIREPARDIPVLAEPGVLVAGGGVAGCAAAYGAARSGARTMLIERNGCLGGVATASYMANIGNFMITADNIKVHEGFAGEVAGVAAALGSASGRSGTDVPVRQIQSALLGQNVKLGDADRLRELGLA